MSAVPVAPGTWRIATPLAGRPREVHAYLVAIAADDFLLVDGGADTEDAWAALQSGVLAVAGTWSRVAAQLITHLHLDHLGLARRVHAASGARLLMGRLDVERARHAAAEPHEEARYREALLRENGAPWEDRAAIEAGRSRGAPPAGFLEPDRELPGEGGPLPEAPGWRWIWTPGHTAGHVSVVREADRVLIAGDAVLPRITPTIGVNRQSEDPVGDYLATLDRIEQVRPLLILPGHGEPVDEPLLRVRELREATLRETERVLACLAASPRTAWAISGRRHPGELPPSTRMLALRETLAHLQRLVASGGALRSRRADGVATFALPSPARAGD